MQKKITILLLTLIFLITSGLGCKGVSEEAEKAMQPVTLTYWRVFDGPDTMSQIIQAYKAMHPNVTIEYRKLRIEEYEDALLNALAEDRGPDMFSIHNTWFKKYQNKIAPAPQSYVLPFQFESGTIKKETKTELRTLSGPSVQSIRRDFVDVVEDDVVLGYTNPQTGQSGNAIYGLPLSVDTLALFYNRDILNNAGIPEPPRTWEEFNDHIKLLTRLEEGGDIIQSGAAIGTADNIERDFDILSLLMMQNGTQMTSPSGIATFAQIPPALSGTNVYPGPDALSFYTGFANPVKEVYTWNDKMPNSTDAFSRGLAAYMFGYSYHLPIIRSLSPKLNFDISKVPQIEDNGNEINYANYWVETVSRKSSHQEWAWDFIKFATSAEQVVSYLDAANKPTALKSLVNTQLEDLDLGYFASQLLTAESWYHGNDPAAAEEIFSEMINSVLDEGVEVREAVNLAQTKINQTIR